MHVAGSRVAGSMVARFKVAGSRVVTRDVKSYMLDRSFCRGGNEVGKAPILVLWIEVKSGVVVEFEVLDDWKGSGRNGRSVLEKFEAVIHRRQRRRRRRRVVIISRIGISRTGISRTGISRTDISRTDISRIKSNNPRLRIRVSPRNPNLSQRTLS